MRRTRLVVYPPAFAASLGSGLAQAPATPVISSPFPVPEIVQAKLLDATRGYITSREKIFYTSTLGKNWIDITPKQAKGDLMSATFASPSDGFAYFAIAEGDSGAASIDVFHTATRGASWSRVSSISEGQALTFLAACSIVPLWITTRLAACVPELQHGFQLF